jgi:hypothetical protein
MDRDASTPRLLKAIAAVITLAIPLAAQVWGRRPTTNRTSSLLDAGRAVI